MTAPFLGFTLPMKLPAKKVLRARHFMRNRYSMRDTAGIIRVSCADLDLALWQSIGLSDAQLRMLQ